MRKLGHSVSSAVQQACQLNQVRKIDLDIGDWVFIYTRNSLYLLQVIESNLFRVSGGWFERKGLSPIELKINGCTWGGSMIKMDIVAACGLCLEFSNRVVTSKIQKIVVFKNHALN